MTEKHPTPFYAFDSENLTKAINDYKAAFQRNLPEALHFYAVKLNHEPSLLKTIFSAGFHADVSSARELLLAHEAGAKKFLFSGPGKTRKELSDALESGLDIIINIDSFSELKRLAEVGEKIGTKCKAGVRVTFNEHGAWDKFGISIGELSRFFQEAAHYKNISLCGIQFHMSWNQNGETFVAAIRQLSEVLLTQEMASFIKQIDFIDVGGGFRPYRSEGYFPEDTLIGSLEKSAAELSGKEHSFTYPYYILNSIPIAEYAQEIGIAVTQYLRPIKDFSYFTEPGRIIVNSALHVVVSVIDVKSENCVITDGGTNIVGFERFEFDYFPVINITHPSLTEKPCAVYGSLCMPQDYWGLRIYADKITEEDIIVIPYQGALTYSTMNDFIKGKAPVYLLEPSE